MAALADAEIRFLADKLRQIEASTRSGLDPLVVALRQHLQDSLTLSQLKQLLRRAAHDKAVQLRGTLDLPIGSYDDSLLYVEQGILLLEAIQNGRKGAEISDSFASGQEFATVFERHQALYQVYFSPLLSFLAEPGAAPAPPDDAGTQETNAAPSPVQAPARGSSWGIEKVIASIAAILAVAELVMLVLYGGSIAGTERLIERSAAILLLALTAGYSFPILATEANTEGRIPWFGLSAMQFRVGGGLGVFMIVSGVAWMLMQSVEAKPPAEADPAKQDTHAKPQDASVKPGETGAESAEKPAGIPAVALPSPAMSPRGADVGKYTRFTWQKFAGDNLSFVFVKSTYGTDQSPAFDGLWEALAGKHIPRALVHTYAHGVDPEQQLKVYLNNFRSLRPELPPTLDLMAAGLTVEDLPAILDWLRTVRAETGRTPIVHLSSSIWRSVLNEPQELGEFSLWVENYVANYTPAAVPSVPGCWPKDNWSFWTFREHGDFSSMRYDSGESPAEIQFNGTAAALQQLFVAPAPD